MEVILWFFFLFLLPAVIIAVLLTQMQSDSYSGLSVSIESERSAGGRHINGRPLSSDADWDLWYVMKGQSEGFERRLSELEREIESPSCEHPEQALEEWYQRYESYRSLCLRYGIWNRLIDDRQPFTASLAQRKAEDCLKERLSQRYEAAELPRQEYRRQMEYEESLCQRLLGTFPGKRSEEVLRHKWLRLAGEQMNAEKADVWKAYRRLLKKGLLKEQKFDNYYLVKKGYPRTSKAESPPPLPPSDFVPGNYANLTRRDRYKARFTVGPCENLDREKNSAEFVSLTCGERYRTSLQKCTCPAFDSPHSPCKHMVALAAQLDYLKLK